MQKPISTKVHGILDFMTAGFLMTLPRVMGWSKTVTTICDSAAVGATGYSLLTKYEMAPRATRVLPMKAHLTLDALSGGALIGAAALLDDEDPEVRLTLGAIGAWEIAAALMTRANSPAEAAGSGRRAQTSGRTGGGASAGGAAGTSMPVAAQRPARVSAGATL